MSTTAKLWAANRREAANCKVHSTSSVLVLQSLGREQPAMIILKIILIN